jgi:hypothetical protein
VSICRNSCSYKYVCTRCTCIDTPMRRKKHQSKDACARAFTQPCASAPAHGPRPGTRRLLNNTSIWGTFFFPKKIGNENPIWESPGFTWRLPKELKRIVTTPECLSLVWAGHHAFSRAGGVGVGRLLCNSCRALFKKHGNIHPAALHFLPYLYTILSPPIYHSNQQPPSIAGRP